MRPDRLGEGGVPGAGTVTARRRLADLGNHAGPERVDPPERDRPEFALEPDERGDVAREGHGAAPGRVGDRHRRRERRLDVGNRGGQHVTSQLDLTLEKARLVAVVDDPTRPGQRAGEEEPKNDH